MPLLVITDAEAVSAKTDDVLLSQLFRRAEVWASCSTHVVRFHERLTLAFMRAIRVFAPGRSEFASVFIGIMYAEYIDERRRARMRYRNAETVVCEQQRISGYNAASEAIQDLSGASQSFLETALGLFGRDKGQSRTQRGLLQQMGLDSKKPPACLEELLRFTLSAG